jgi:hypothetical protein
MLYFIQMVVGAEFWIGVVVGTVLGKHIVTVLKWAWNKIPRVPKL